ncbi:MAG: MBL fold metallo-hydrolase, partial [Rhodobacteraceae bacterium]|nr:MBL fold metallo-hydrolase [Paracoccaceae bacterium]
MELLGRRLVLGSLGEWPGCGARPDLSRVGRGDAVLISHLHPDHAGALDLLVDQGDPPVFASDPVRALASGFAASGLL